MSRVVGIERSPARKMMIWNPSPAQIAVTMIDGNAQVVEFRNSICGRPTRPRRELMSPVGAG